MAVFNAAKREIDIKIVYYGPALCGKTTNVQCIHRMLAPDQRGELMSLATKDDRTLFFDFLPIELGDVKGFKTRFHVYTVPGQVYYALTRRAVLTGVDGVVFVADSQKSKLQENIESLNDLSENLRYYKKDLATLPFIIQYNKRDLPEILSIAELNAALNTRQVPFFAASALQGTGVVETLTAICKAVLKHLDKTKSKKPEAPSAPTERLAAPLPPEPAPQISEETEPVITIFRGNESEAKAAPSRGQTDFVGTPLADTSMQPVQESLLRLEPETPAKKSEPEISFDTFVSSPPDIPPSSFSRDQTPPEPDVRSLSLQRAEGSGVQIVSCGQPHKISDTMVKIPLTVRLGKEEQQHTLHITISLD